MEAAGSRSVFAVRAFQVLKYLIHSTKRLFPHPLRPCTLSTKPPSFAFLLLTPLQASYIKSPFSAKVKSRLFVFICLFFLCIRWPMSTVFDNYPPPLPPHQHHHHYHNVNVVPRSLTMPAPASQVHNFPSLSNQQQQQQSQSPQTQSTQTTTFSQAPQDPKKRHACPTCSRAFTTSGHLARHIRVHTGERNHKCPFPGCETRCSRQDNLQQQ